MGDAIDKSNLLNIHKYLMVKNNIFGFLKKCLFDYQVFVDLYQLNVLSLNNEWCETRTALIDLNPVELNYYQFMISLDKCNGSCSILTVYLAKFVSQNKIEDANLRVFNLITRKNESKTSIKHILVQIANASLMVANVT